VGAAIGVRWTIGDARARGYEALHCPSGAPATYSGPTPAYVVAVNHVAPEEARSHTGPVPGAVMWRMMEGYAEQFIGRGVRAKARRQDNSA
jgi:hypothetical protein